MSAEAPGSQETVDDFRQRARSWIQTNFRRLEPGESAGATLRALDEDAEQAIVSRSRVLQRQLFDAGLAGICFPREYGGQGLTPAHQRALNEELVGYEFPAHIQVPTFSPCAAVLLDFGTEEQKLRHIPAILKGEEIWMQFLSEPSGGSDVAAALTTAVRDDDEWVLNGSKIWTTGAWFADWGLCLARTNWDVPKHRGLTVFILPIRQPGVDIHRIEMLNGNMEFCQEFLTDVVVPDSDRLGEVDAGWDVVTRWLYHERTISGGSKYVTGQGNQSSEGPYEPDVMVQLARSRGGWDQERTQELIGEARILSLVRSALVQSVTRKMQEGTLPHHAAAMLRLFSGMATTRRATIAFELAGEEGVVWSPDERTDAQVALGYLVRQAACIGGGTTEMARNVISERLLGMPRERRADADAFRDVPRGPGSIAPG